MLKYKYLIGFYDFHYSSGILSDVVAVSNSFSQATQFIAKKLLLHKLGIESCDYFLDDSGMVYELIDTQNDYSLVFDVDSIIEIETLNELLSKYKEQIIWEIYQEYDNPGMLEIPLCNLKLKLDQCDVDTLLENTGKGHKLMGKEALFTLFIND